MGEESAAVLRIGQTEDVDRFTYHSYDMRFVVEYMSDGSMALVEYWPKERQATPDADGNDTRDYPTRRGRIATFKTLAEAQAWFEGFCDGAGKFGA